MSNFVIETTNISKKYAAKKVVDSLNLKVPKGEVYGFLGQNGAGKTTTIRMLLGLMKSNEGSISIFGLDPHTHLREILSKIGSLVEMPSLYSNLTGQENLRLIVQLLGIPSDRPQNILKRVGLEGAANELVASYSLGMKQRLGLGLALINEPELLILDEPTNGLDPQGIREVRDFLKKLTTESGVTVFLSSHLLSEIELIADHIGIIDKGKLLFQGTIEDLSQQFPRTIIIRCNNTTKSKQLLNKHLMNSTIIDASTLSISAVPDAKVAQIIQLLASNNIAIFSVIPHQGSLEEMFMQVTEKGTI